VINVHLLDASNRFAKTRDQILELTQNTIARVQEMMSVDQVNVILCYNPLGTMPNSVGGFAPSNDTALIYLDSNSADFESNLEHQLPSVIAHELHHAIRWNNPGYGTFVSEGLAQAFELPFLDGRMPVFSQLEESERLNELMDLARLEFHHDLSIYHEWFGGYNARNIPRLSGYAIGFEIVRQYLEKADTTAGAAYAVTAQTVLETLEA
jgi:uncharacterized protein YjaZ